MSAAAAAASSGCKEELVFDLSSFYIVIASHEFFQQKTYACHNSDHVLDLVLQVISLSCKQQQTAATVKRR
jgi:hypothetical protein